MAHTWIISKYVFKKIKDSICGKFSSLRFFADFKTAALKLCCYLFGSKNAKKKKKKRKDDTKLTVGNLSKRTKSHNSALKILRKTKPRGFEICFCVFFMPWC